MSEKKVSSCDMCCKISELPESYDGWISIEGEIKDIKRYTNHRYSTGGRWDNVGSREYIKNPDFCSFKCLIEYFKTKLNISVDEDFDS